jgi:hypothetical protein
MNIDEDMLVVKITDDYRIQKREDEPRKIDEV